MKFRTKQHKCTTLHEADEAQASKLLWDTYRWLQNSENNDEDRNVQYSLRIERFGVFQITDSHDDSAMFVQAQAFRLPYETKET